MIHGNVLRGTSSTEFVGSSVWVFNKTNMYAGGTGSPTNFSYTTTNGAGGIIPAVTLDNSASTLYLAQSANGASGALRIFSISGALGAETFNFVTNAVYCTNSTWADITGSTMTILPQQGSAEKLNAVDTRIQNVLYRNGRLWCTHDIFLPTNNPSRCAIQWWCVNPTNATVVSQGRIDDDTGRTNYAFPSIAVNKFNDVLIGFSMFSTNIYPSAAYSFRAFYDQPSKALRNGRIFKAGEGTFTQNGSWGDYSATVVDPVNDADFWTIQQSSSTNAPDENSAKWATWWAHVKVDYPANDHFTNATVLNPLSGSLTNVNYRGSKETGETNHAGIVGGASVWYQWTPTNTARASIDTVGTSIPTTLAVYTGTSVSNLTLVGSDDYSDGIARVVFDAVSNTTYRVAVDGYDGGSGQVVLNWLAKLAPTILRQPQSTNAITNELAMFTIEAVGVTPLTNHWYHEGTNIAVTTSQTYTITNVQLSHATNYYVAVTNWAGGATSDVAGSFVFENSSARMSLWGKNTTSTWFHVSGVTNRQFRVETSTNLHDWSSTSTNTTSFWLTNLIGTNDLARFYRAITNN